MKVLVDKGADVGAMTLLGKTPLIIAKEKRMKCELYEERQTKIFRRDAILALLSSKPQPVSEYLCVAFVIFFSFFFFANFFLSFFFRYQLESFYPN